MLRQACLPRNTRGPQLAEVRTPGEPSGPPVLAPHKTNEPGDVTSADHASSNDFWTAYQWWILGALITVGAYLRLVDLGLLSFRWDEDLSSLAAKAIAERGVPELPSGMVYLRSLAFLYVLAASGLVFGFSEWALRLPAALFGIALIPLAFAFGKRLFGVGVGLVLAALVTLSVWDIEFSRYARMYAPFGFFYLLTLLGIWRYRVVEQSLRGGVLCIAFALVAVSLHDLGYTLALAFLVPPLLAGRQALQEPRRLAVPAAAFGVVAAFFFVWGRIQGHYYNMAAIRADETAAAAGSAGADAAAAQAPGTDAALPGADSGAGPEQVGGALDVLLGAVERIASQLQPPPAPAFAALAESSPSAAVMIVAIPLLAALAFVISRRRSLDPASMLLLPAVAICCGVQLFNLALLAALALAFVKRRGIAGFRTVDFGAAVALIGAWFVLWLGLTLGLDLLAPGAGAREAVRQLLNYPAFFVFWGFPNEYPLMSIPALVGGLWIFDRVARERPDPAALFLVAVFALPTIMNGLFETRYQTYRYNVPFGPLFFAFVALGIVKWRETLAAWPAGGAVRVLHPREPALVTAGLAAAVLAFDMNPLRSWLATQRAYANEGALYSFFDLRGFRDFRSAVGYVIEHANAGDKILTFDCREYFNYFGRLDYCLVSGTYREGDELIQTYVDGGTYRDLYLSTPMIMNLDELKHVLHKTGGTKWLLASDSMLENLTAADAELRLFLEHSGEHVVHAALDDDTKVYRF